MKIIYVATMHDKDSFNRIFIKEKKPIQAAGKYHQLMCEGLVKNGVDLETIALLPINSGNCDKKFIKGFESSENGVNYKYLPVINISFLKQFFSFFASFFRVFKQPKNSILIADYLNLFATKGALVAAKIKGMKSICIVTDLPEYLGRQSMAKKYRSTFKSFDGFVFLTEAMNEKVNKLNKPYIVLEGHSNALMKDRVHYPFETKKKIVLYAGTLDYKYGILNLCEAFRLSHKENEELHIYGDGDSKDKVVEYSKNDNSIKYFGNVSNHIVIDAELKAHLLVNPREGKEEFTKYSFPSKTMEYMATGTPVLMYDLPGLPNEYKPYLYLVNDSLLFELRKCLDLPIEVISNTGKLAKNFVVSKKNNIIQAEKLKDYITCYFLKDKGTKK